MTPAYPIRGCGIAAWSSGSEAASRARAKWSVSTLDGKQCMLDARKGYNVVLWKERGLLYGLVSDVQSAELLQLAEKF